MKLCEAIYGIKNNINNNSYKNVDEIVMFINECEEHVNRYIFNTEEWPPVYKWPEDDDTELVVGDEFAELYIKYGCAKFNFMYEQWSEYAKNMGDFIILKDKLEKKYKKALNEALEAKK